MPPWSNGSIAGDLTYGVASTVPGTVTVTGNKSLLAYDVAASFKNLESLSTLLGGMAATGTVTSSGGTLTLKGTSTGLNVFQISADALKQATSIAITVPASAAAIFNVTGASVDISNKGVTLTGRDRGEDALELPGCALPARGVDRPVGVDAGAAGEPHLRQREHERDGRGAQLLSAGSGTLLHTPLNVSSVFTQATPSEVALMAASPLVGGCTYQFQIPSSPALTSSGACLAAPLSVTFIVAKHPVSPAARELQSLQLDEKTRTLGRFTARANINTPVEDALARYESAIGISAANLVATGAPVPSATRKGQVVTQYQQYTQGYPIAGYGYFVVVGERELPQRERPRRAELPGAAGGADADDHVGGGAAEGAHVPEDHAGALGEDAGEVQGARRGSWSSSRRRPSRRRPTSRSPGPSRSARRPASANPADIQVDAVTGAVVAVSPGLKAADLDLNIHLPGPGRRDGRHDLQRDAGTSAPRSTRPRTTRS